jgi:hypothetical protein
MSSDSDSDSDGFISNFFGQIDRRRFSLARYGRTAVGCLGMRANTGRGPLGPGQIHLGYGNGRDIIIPYPRNDPPSDPRFLVPLPPMNVPNSPGDRRVVFLSRDSNEGSGQPLVEFPDMPLEEEVENQAHEQQATHPLNPVVLAAHPETFDEVESQLKAALRGNNSSALELVGLIQKLATFLPASDPAQFQDKVSELFEKSSDVCFRDRLDDAFFPVCSSSPSVMQSHGILIISAQGDHQLPDMPNHALENMGRKSMTDLMVDKELDGHRCTVYYKSCQTDQQNGLSWLARSTDPEHFDIIPLRENEGTEKFSSKNRKLIPLEVCIHVHTCSLQKNKEMHDILRVP